MGVGSICASGMRRADPGDAFFEASAGECEAVVADAADDDGMGDWLAAEAEDCGVVGSGARGAANCRAACSGNGGRALGSAAAGTGAGALLLGANIAMASAFGAEKVGRREAMQRAHAAQIEVGNE